MDDDREYQRVIITLDDGSTGVFTGRVLGRPGDARQIVSIKFTEPQQLPEDCSWGLMGGDEEWTDD